MLLFLSLLILLLPPEDLTSPISCYNDRGVPVDWFYVYKLPRAASGEVAEEGLRYLLLEKGSEGWTEGQVNINDTSGAVGRTVGQLYSRQDSEMAYILYNDQSPVERFGGISRSSGHTKGVVVLDKSQGFWLVHSTPHFPPVQEAGQYSYPESGLNNGQNFLCVTYTLEHFQTIGEQLHINQPHVFDCAVPEALASLVPTLAALCHKFNPLKPAPSLTEPVSNRSVALSSREGTHFISFAKGATFNNDLYHWWVAPTLQTNLLVQFWVRSTGVLPSDCSGDWRVLNIQQLQPGQSSTFNTSQDHSKWAVSSEGGISRQGVAAASGGWVCVGDINRNEAEEKRGGGTVCQQDPLVWKAYRSAALQCQNCEGKTAPC